MKHFPEATSQTPKVITRVTLYLSTTLWRSFLTLIIGLGVSITGRTQTLILADRVFDGEEMHQNWAVLVTANKITAVGSIDHIKAPKDATIIRTKGTLLPGLIEGHSHLLLYPYNQTAWDDQVLKEADAYRTARATVHARNTLLAGFTTVRDLGTEGAGYSDVALKRAINEGLIPGPRMVVAGRAIVSTGSYGPKGFDSDSKIMLGAEPADGNELIRVVRDQIGQGADFIKIYADYRWGLSNEDQPSFTSDELKLINEVTRSSGRVMVCHAKSKEAMKRAILAGAVTIEHGDYLDDEIAALMKSHGVTYFPTLAAVESIQQYRGWQKGKNQEPGLVTQKKQGFKIAYQAGVTIGMGGDVGVYPHGENALEMELMEEYGMKSLDVLKAATSINARMLRMENQIGFIKPGWLADLVIVDGDPSQNISSVRKVLWVMKDGVIYRNDFKK